MKASELEKYSSAVTLSDMELFVFPELMYSLVLANIMSPVLWRWRKLDWVKKLEGKSSYRKLVRMKQYIMDQYEFNLDLETWGLTRQDKELKRFENVLSPEKIVGSNALFGYQGDKYYFDVDIRKHFGLDQYDSDVIPYWKTETIEAMNAFIHKPGYKTGAGECVSLSSLYAAAAFVVCGIPLENIFMILTPLHSQNFIDVQDVVLTNNRRIVTKSMWFNGTAITFKAQRAIRNETVTTVVHPSGYIHCIYQDATISKHAYKKFMKKLSSFLTTDIDLLILANFLRSFEEYQKYFLFCREYRGKKTYIKAEKLYHYEHGSSMRIGEDTFDKLYEEVSEEDFSPCNIPDRLCCEQLRAFIEYEKIDLQQSEDRAKLIDYIKRFVPNAEEFADNLANFIHAEAKLPSAEKNYIKTTPFSLSSIMISPTTIGSKVTIKNYLFRVII